MGTNKRVKKALIDQDLTATKLAEITGYTPSHINNIINGRLESVWAKKVTALALGENFRELWADNNASKV